MVLIWNQTFRSLMIVNSLFTLWRLQVKKTPRQMLSLAVATVAQVTVVALTRSCPSYTQVLFHDVSALTRKLFPIVEAMQKHFSSGSGAYYSDAIFFLSVAMHRIMPDSKGPPPCHVSQINL